MKSSARIILYSLVILIIITAAAVIVFKNKLLDALSVQTGISSSIDDIKPMVANRDRLDISVLENKKIAELRNLSNFDFDNICHRAESQVVIINPVVEEIVSQEATTTEEEAAPVECRKGNNSPFYIKKK